MVSGLMPLARKENLVVQKLSDEILIYDLRENRAFCLNSTAASIWQACDGSKTIAEIGRSIGSEDLVWLALDQLKKENLIENMVENKYSLLSRREAIKKIGLSSMIALPLVSSLVVPSAVYAQGTCTPNNLTCTTSSQCCSGCCKDVGGGINECKPGGGACL